jgi:hypothetical protein
MDTHNHKIHAWLNLSLHVFTTTHAAEQSTKSLHKASFDVVHCVTHLQRWWERHCPLTSRTTCCCRILLLLLCCVLVCLFLAGLLLR